MSNSGRVGGRSRHLCACAQEQRSEPVRMDCESARQKNRWIRCVWCGGMRGDRVKFALCAHVAQTTSIENLHAHQAYRAPRAQPTLSQNAHPSSSAPATLIQRVHPASHAHATRAHLASHTHGHNAHSAHITHITLFAMPCD